MIEFSIVNNIGHAIERISKGLGRNPMGKRIRIVVDDGIDETLLGKSATGVVLTQPANVFTSSSSGSTLSQCVVIQLDSPLRYMQRNIETLAVVPRHVGFIAYPLRLQ